MAKNNVKYIFVTGGVVSSLGKGIAAASLGLLLKSRGLRVTIQKFDPYINVDPGTMNPFQHGEVYVTDDGAETDLDLGHYERFLDVSTTRPWKQPAYRRGRFRRDAATLVLGLESASSRKNGRRTEMRSPEIHPQEPL